MMQDYSKLVEALRHLSTGRCDDSRKCELCAIYETCLTRCVLDAADAIEELEGFLAEAERDRDEYEERMRKEQERVIELQAEADALAHDIERYVGINAELTTEIEALQAEVEILKVSGREAYFEGLAADDNGRQVEKLAKRNAELHAELEKWVSAAEKAGEPKRGKWIGVSPMVDTVQCSICGGQLFSAELETPYCPYCGAEMEVQDG